MRSSWHFFPAFLFALFVFSLASAESYEFASLREAYEYQANRGYFAQAVSLATRQLELATSLYSPPHPEIASAMLDMGNGYAGLGEYKRAENYLQRALEMRRALYGTDHVDYAEALEALSNLVVRQDEVDRAEALAREALAIRTRVLGEEHTDLAFSYECLGRALNARGRIADSEDILREALQRYEAAGDSLNVADCAYELGAVRLRGSWVESQAFLQRALRIYREVLGPENGPVADCLNGLGLTYGYSDSAKEEQLFRECLAIRQKIYGDVHPLVIQSRSNIATLLARGGRLQEAEATYREIISISEELYGKDDSRNSPKYHNLAWTLWKQGRLDEANDALEHAIEIRRAVLGDNDYFIAYSVAYQAWIAFERGDYDGAVAHFDDLIARNARLYGPSNHRNVRNLEMLGLCAWASGDLSGAEEYLMRSAALFERVRLMAARGFGRSTFMTSPYERLAAVRLELGRGNEAWAAVERVRGLSLSELLLAAEVRRLTNLEEAEEDSLAHALSDAEAKLVIRIQEACDEQTPDAESATIDARHELVEIQAQWDDLQNRLARRYPITEGLDITLEEVQSTLAGNTAMIGWLDADPTKTRTVSWAYVIRSEGDVRWEKLGETEHTAPNDRIDPVRDFNNLLIEQGRSAFISEQGRLALMAKAREVSETRFTPLEKHLSGVDELIVIPSGGMACLPVECLVGTDGAWVGECFVVSYSPSAAIAIWLREKEPPTGDRPTTALLVGDPPFREEHAVAMAGVRDDEPLAMVTRSVRMPDEAVLRGALDGSREALAELPRLVASRQEVQSVASVFAETRLLVGEDASEEAIATMADTGEIGRFDVVHFATHALIDNAQPERSALVMSQLPVSGWDDSGQAGVNGLITTAEIVRLWDLDAELVTLSACQTALGKATAEGTLGLVNAFLQAGGRCILVSLWDVDDEATALLMKRFYETWLGSIDDGDPMSKAEALRHAKVWLRRYGESDTPYDHPYYWSAFVLVGDAR